MKENLAAEIDVNQKEMALAAYEKHFGARAKYLVRAPGRVNLIGEHTDYNQGLVFPAAIDREMIIVATPRSDSRVAAYSLEYGEEDEFDLHTFAKIPAPHKQWANYLRAVLSTLQKRGYVISGFNAVLSGNVPQGAGLSSSAAYEVAVATLCNGVDNLHISGKDIALIAQQAENEFIGVQCGIMDQFISALGLADAALMIDCRSLDYRSVPLQLAKHGCSIIITNSGVRRGLVDSEYNVRRSQCTEGTAALSKLCGRHLDSLRDIGLAEFEKFAPDLDPIVARRCRHVVTENQRVTDAVAALESGNLRAFGLLMNASHASLRDDFAVSCGEIDQLVELSQKHAGVLGARITGGGFGGCTVAIVRDADCQSFIDQVMPKYRTATGKEPTVYVCRAMDGTSFAAL